MFSLRDIGDLIIPKIDDFLVHFVLCRLYLEYVYFPAGAIVIFSGYFLRTIKLMTALYDLALHGARLIDSRSRT